MPFLENATDYAEDDQVTHTNLNALTESAKPVKAGAGVTNSGNTTDETTLDVDANGQLKVKDGGVDTTQLADDAVTTAKILDANVTTAKIADLGVTTAKLAADAVDGTKLADDAVDSEHIADTAISGTTATTDTPNGADEALMYDSGPNVNRAMTLDTLSKFEAFPQAHGTVQFSNGNSSLTNSHNVSSAAEVGATREITLSAAMASTNYVVITSLGGTSATTANAAAVVEIDSTTQFTIYHTEEADLLVHFVVFGLRP